MWCPGVFRCISPYLPLNLPHVDEVLAQLPRQHVMPSEQGECPGRAVPPPVGQQAGAAVQVEHGDIPELRARVTAHYYLQRRRHVGPSTTTAHTREEGCHFLTRCMLGHVGKMQPRKHYCTVLYCTVQYYNTVQDYFILYYTYTIYHDIYYTTHYNTLYITITGETHSCSMSICMF